MCLFCTTHQKQTAAEAEALQVEVASWVTAAREGVLQQFEQVRTQTFYRNTAVMLLLLGFTLQLVALVIVLLLCML
jgi:hypothetical protein